MTECRARRITRSVTLGIAALLLPTSAAFAQGVDPCVYRNERGSVVITDDLANSPCRPAPAPTPLRPPARLKLTFRTAELISLAHQLAERHGVDHRLVESLVEVESRFNSNAVSRAGAMGLMQLMPSLAREHGVDDPFEPWDNLDAGIRYLRKLLVRYEADLERTLAAYNAGPGAVDRYDGIPPYAETHEYVRRVLYRYRQRVADVLLH